MNNQLIKKEDITIFDKIKLFLKKLFYKKNKQEVIIPKIEENKYEQNTKFEDSLKFNVSEVYEKEKKFKSFIQEIEENPDIVEKLSSDRLDKLIAYYEKITTEKEAKIISIKKNLS